MTQNIAIVGSGFLGMTLALRLAESGANVTLFESADRDRRPGFGVGDRRRRLGQALSRDARVGYIHPKARRGTRSRRRISIGSRPKTGFYTDGELVSMSDTMEFLRFPPLGLISKLRLGATIFFASRVKDWKPLEKISVEDWLTKLSGKKTFEKIWKPLLKAKLGEAYKETSAAFIWATIQRMYAARNSGLKKEMFGYVRGGYARVLERFGEVLLEKGVEIRLNSRVEEIEKLENGKLPRVICRRQARRSDTKGRGAAAKDKIRQCCRRPRSSLRVFPVHFFPNPRLSTNGRSRFSRRVRRHLRQGDPDLPVKCRGKDRTAADRHRESRILKISDIRASSVRRS